MRRMSALERCSNESRESLPGCGNRRESQVAAKPRQRVASVASLWVASCPISSSRAAATAIHRWHIGSPSQITRTLPRHRFPEATAAAAVRLCIVFGIRSAGYTCSYLPSRLRR
jgi:hypothetical protein